MPVSEETLAAELTERADGEDQGNRSSQKRRIELRHRILPKLADEGHITWEQSREAVTAVDFEGMTAAEYEAISDRLAQRDDDAAGAIPTERRRVIVSVLERRDGPCHRSELAEIVATTEGRKKQTDESVPEVTVELHHRHLPKLDQAGLIEYDTADGTATLSE